MYGQKLGFLRIDKDGMQFCVASSGARQGEALAYAVMKRGIREVVIACANDEEGKRLSEDFCAKFKALGGSVRRIRMYCGALVEIAGALSELALVGTSHLLVIGSMDRGGQHFLRAAVGTGAFSNFLLSDDMIGDDLIEVFELDLFGMRPCVPSADSAPRCGC